MKQFLTLKTLLKRKTLLHPISKENLSVQEIFDDVNEAKKNGLSGQPAFTLETVQMLLDYILKFLKISSVDNELIVVFRRSNSGDHNYFFGNFTSLDRANQAISEFIKTLPEFTTESFNIQTKRLNSSSQWKSK